MDTFATPRPNPAPATEADALVELGRFFRLTQQPHARDENGLMPMFSAFIDAAWHRMLDNPAAYRAFSHQHAGTLIGHQKVTGHSRVAWIELYEAVYGPLPPVWFADTSGMVDEDLLATYQRTGTVVTDWECGPIEGEPSDPPDEGTAEPRPTHTPPPQPQELPDPGWGQ